MLSLTTMSYVSINQFITPMQEYGTGSDYSTVLQKITYSPSVTSESRDYRLQAQESNKEGSKTLVDNSSYKLQVQCSNCKMPTIAYNILSTIVFLYMTNP